MTLVDIVTIVGGLGSVAGTLYGFYRFVIKPMIKLFLKFKQTLVLIEKMHEEFKPNGGSSLRDAINRIETKLLIEQNARRAMSMGMDVGMFESDGQGMCTWVNQYYTNLSGLTIDEAKNFGWVTGIYEEDRERVVEEWTAAVKQKRIFKLDYGMFNARTAEYATVHCVAFPIATVKQEIIGFVGIVTRRNQELVRPKYITSL